MTVIAFGVVFAGSALLKAFDQGHFMLLMIYALIVLIASLSIGGMLWLILSFLPRKEQYEKSKGKIK